MKFFASSNQTNKSPTTLLKHALWVCTLWCSVAVADSVDSLSLFLKNTRSMRADFVQTVTSPAKENRPAKSKTSSGTFAFVRPTVFRFD
jgi:outer membrane lipoprotein carrier protein